MSPCFYCGSFDSSPMRHADGRIVCRDCCNHAIYTEKNLRIVTEWTVNQVIALGLKFRRGTTTVRLVNRDQMMIMGRSDAVGLAINRRVSFFGMTRHQDAEVLVLYGSPVASIIWTLAHEIGHVIVSQHSYQFTPREHEEGFCELLAFLVTDKSKNPQARAAIAREWVNPDPVYGGGLRREYGLCRPNPPEYFRRFM